MGKTTTIIIFWIEQEILKICIKLHGALNSLPREIKL